MDLKLNVFRILASISLISSYVNFVSCNTNQHCPLYWTSYSSSCYRPRWINLKTWQEAKDWCTAQGADLVKIETVQERNWLVSLTNGIQNHSHASDHWWTGLNNLDPNSNQFVWGDNSPLDPNVQGGQQIHPSVNEHCVSIIKPGKLRNVNCGQKHPYICERAAGIPLTCDADNGWQQFNTYCYKVHNDNQNWNQASAKCDKDGGSLVQIENEQDEIVIHDFAKNTNSPIWIGLRSYKFGTAQPQWMWTNGTVLDPSINYWNNGMVPRLQGNQQNNTCVWMSNTQADYHKSWRTDNCGSRKHYVCKRPEGVCASGWIPHQRKCFQFNIRFKKSWRNAESFCKAEGGHLVSIPGQTFMAFMNSYLDELREAQIDSVWIGLNDQNKDAGPFVWSNGGQLGRFQNWIHSPPTNHRGQLDCTYIVTGDQAGKWRPTNNCNQQKAFVCQANMGQQIKTVTTPRPQFKCDSGWKLHAGKCHKFVDKTQNWINARTACKALAADLATVRNPDMQTYIQSQLHGNEYWIGLSDRTREGQYYWLDETVKSTYFHWANKQPDNGNHQENCVEIKSGGFWNDRACYTPLKYICQKDASNAQLPVTPSTTALPFSRKCGLNWEEDPNSDWCYQFHDEQLTWSDARGVCINQHGDLASIQSREEQFYIGTKVATMNSVGLWIGAQDWSKEGGWSWVDKSPFAYLNWSPGQPDDFKHNEDCAAIWSFNRMWNDYPCSNRNGFICKKFSNKRTTTYHTTVPKTPAGYTLGCPDYWKQHGGACFKVITRSLNWMQAQQLCRQNGGFLASINSADEQNFIRTIMPHKTNASWYGYWIGLNDQLIDMKFQWTDGSPVVYTNWGTNEPNNWMHHKEDCVVVLMRSGGWNDAVCTDPSQGLICKRPVMVVSNTKAPENQGCTLPGRGYGSLCYSVITGRRLAWQDAQTDCKNRFKGNLATINSRYIQAFITNYLPHNFDFFWNGLSDTVTQGTYKWVSGQAVQFSYWDQSHTGNEMASCVAVRSSQPIGLWVNKNCTEKHTYICESPRSGYTTPQPTVAPAQLPCPQNWTAYGSYCYRSYKFSTAKSRLTWEESRDYCRGLGGDLISIHSQGEQDFVTGTLLASSTRYSGYWIGLNDRAQEAGHVWSDGTPTDYTSWSPHEPNDYNHQEDCVQMDMSTRKWNDNNCFFSMNFICKIARGVQLQTSVTPPMAVTSAACGPGWIAYNSNCYMFVTNTSQTWYDARSYCMGMGSDLASIHSLDESNLILSQAVKQGKEDYWLGLNELQMHGTYIWSDGTVTDFSNWRSGEPNDAFGGERCVNLNIYGGTWNDLHCENKIPFICKRASSSATKPVTTPSPQLINGGCPNPSFKPVPHSNKCYAIVTAAQTWQTARDSCRTNYPGSDIASINSQLEQEFLTAAIQSIPYSVWIGLNKIGHRSKFVWQDNSQFNYQNWAPNEPNSAPSGGKVVRNSLRSLYYYGLVECVEMYADEDKVGQWNDARCNKAQGYVCQISKNAGSPVVSQQGNCPSGFVSWKTSCYRYVSGGATWTIANQQCSQLNPSATLVVLNNVYEDAYVQSMVGCKGCGYWIGLSDQQTSGTYRWIVNWPVYYTNWGAGEPTRATGEGCVAVTNNVWNDTNCQSNMGYVCEINSVAPPPTTAPPVGHCANPSQTLVGDYCYYFSRYKTATWPGANYMCQKLGMALASIHSMAEQSLIYNTFMNMVPMQNETASGSPNIWLGMTKGLSDGFSWTDNTAVNYLNWAPNEPSDPLQATKEECVEMYGNNGQWNDKDCFTNRKYVCKSVALGVTTRFMPSTQNIGNLPSIIPVQGATTGRPFRPTLPIGPGPGQPTFPQRPITNPATQYIPPGKTKNYPAISYPSGGTARQQAPQNNNNNNNSNSGLSGGGLAGILIACIFILVIIAFGLIFLKRRQSPPINTPAEGFDNKVYFSTSEETVQSGKATNGPSYDADA